MGAPPHDPDADLAIRFRAGDHAAFTEIVEKYRPRVRALVFRYVRRTEDAEDLAQIVFTRAFERRETYRGESSISTWIFRIAINMAINYVRSQPPVAETELEDEGVFTESLRTSKLVAAEVWRRVIDRLSVLPPKQRLVLELRLFHELPFSEIGVLAECSEDAAKVNFHHALKALKNIIPAPGSS